MATTIPSKATVTCAGSYYLPDKKGIGTFSDLKIAIPEHKAHQALSTVRGILKQHLRTFFPDAVRLEKVKIVAIESESLSKKGKPVDVMSLAELMYVIEDKEMRINVKEFTSLQELRHAVKLYLVSEKDALAYIKSKRQAFKEERELMELNPELAAKSRDYLDPSQIDEAQKVKVEKPTKDFHKASTADLNPDKPDTDPLTGLPLDDEDIDPDDEDNDPEVFRQKLLEEAKGLGLNPNPRTGIPKLQAAIKAKKDELGITGDDDGDDI